MDDEVLKIKSQTLPRTDDTEYFEVAWSSEPGYHESNNNYDYKRVLEIIIKTCPTRIVIDPEGMNSITLVRLLHDLQMYHITTRRIQRGGEFVEKYFYYDLVLQLKPKS